MREADSTEAARLHSAQVNVFDVRNSLLGSPTLRIIDPISEWTLDSGVTYSKTRDRFEDGAGDEVNVDHLVQAYTEARYVPVIERPNPVLVFAGLMELPGMQILVKYSAAVDAALDDYWAILMAGKLYRLTDRTEREYIPHATTTPVLIKLGLQEQVETYA